MVFYLHRSACVLKLFPFKIVTVLWLKPKLLKKSVSFGLFYLLEFQIYSFISFTVFFLRVFYRFSFPNNHCLLNFKNSDKKSVSLPLAFLLTSS